MGARSQDDLAVCQVKRASLLAEAERMLGP